MILVRCSTLSSVIGRNAIQQQVFRSQYSALYCHGFPLMQQCIRERPTAEQFHTSPQIKAQKNYYSILGVSENSTSGYIKKAYFKLAKKYHPDTNPNNKDAQRKFQEISEAYHVLGNENKRKQYDVYGSSSHQSYRSKSQFNQGFNPFGNQWQNADVKYAFRSNISQNEAEEMFKRIMSEFRNIQGFSQASGSGVKQNVTSRIGGFVFEKVMNSLTKKILEELEKNNNNEFSKATRNDFTNSKKWKK